MGKTVLLTYLGKHSKREVYSNFKIDIPNYKSLEVVDLLDLKHDIDVLIDEGYTWLESRTSGSSLNRYLSYIVLQSRKRTIDIIITAQMYSSIDVRFREQADILIKCKKTKEGFRYRFLFIESDKTAVFLLPFNEAELYYPLFDTYEIVEPYTKELLGMKLLDSKPKEKYEKIMKIGEVIMEIFTKGKTDDEALKSITHSRVLAELMKAGYDRMYEPLVYVFLQDTLSS